MSDLDTLVKEHIEMQPGVSTFVDNILAKEKLDEQSTTNESVPSGNDNGSNGGVLNSPVFDPTIHCTDANGNPIRNRDGSFRRKPGRKPGGGGSGQPSPIELDPLRVKAKQAAEAAVATIFTLGQAIGGEEWTPIVDEKHGVNEPAQMKAAYEEYFYATGAVDVPPWLGLAIATGAYVVPRLTMPKTQSRLSRFAGWCKRLFTRAKK